MGDRYAIEGLENAASGTPVAVLQATNDTTIRGRIYDVMMSAEGTMADEIGTWDISRFTGAPTDTTVIPRPLDPAAPAALHSDCGENGGTTGTITADSEMFSQGIHLRAAFRWVAVPGGELVLSAASAEGIVVRMSAPAFTGSVHSTVHFEE